MNYTDIIGQSEVITSLMNSIKHNRIGHAYIFSGPKGIGKKTVARIFAAQLICSRAEPSEACGQCQPCLLYGTHSNPDYHEIKTEGASIGVDEIRELQGDIVIRPMYSGKKVYLITDAEKMTAQAQNCLLKTLEEPPEYAVIILATSNYDALLETVRSRTVRYAFKKNTFSEVCEVLKRTFGEKLNGVEFIASYADGVIGSAVELAGSEEFISLREKTVDLLLKLSRPKLMDAFDAYSFFEENKENVDSIFNVMLLLYRDLLLYKTAGNENVLINSDKKDIIVSNVSGFSVQRLVRSIETIEMTRKKIKHNVNYQLSIEVMLMKLQEE